MTRKMVIGRLKVERSAQVNNRRFVKRVRIMERVKGPARPQALYLVHVHDRIHSQIATMPPVLRLYLMLKITLLNYVARLRLDIVRR